ncbi:hypothetical protein JCM33374_g3087 [Metschnikowia sp. JCM 33374]|nr:hypothetical protein JCM33374_g3087 [Metschnikowia sp. JCM 33374]
MLAYIEDPSSDSCRTFVRATLHDILSVDNDKSKAAAGVALSYLKRLALTGRVNSRPLFLKYMYSDILYRHVPQEKWSDLFAAMVQTNIKFTEFNHYNMIREHLLSGSALEKFVGRTGWINPKWHDTERTSFPDHQKEIMVHSFSLQELASSTQQAIRQKDVTMANLFLEILVTKFESLGDTAFLQLVLSVMLSHSMAFKGPQECLKFLQYIRKAGLKIVPSTLLRILTALRIDCFYNEALLLVNYLHMEKLSPKEHSSLVDEIMKVITGKFSLHPKIAVAYFTSLFNDETDIALRTLKDLSLLDVIYGPGSVDSSFSVIQKAEIHDDLKNSPMTHASLREIYSVTLRGLSDGQPTNPALVSKFYESYKKKITEAKTCSVPLGPFSEKSLDESILTLFLDHLLREDPESRQDMELVEDHLNFSVAKVICLDFLRSHGRRDIVKDTYVLDLMIYSGLLKHQDLMFALRIFKKGREMGSPITFNQVYPFIMHHYSKGETDHAERWFHLLVKSGAEAKSVAADKLFKIARENNWAVTGTQYRNNVRIKIRAAREQMEKLRADPVMGLPGMEMIADAGPNQLDSADINLGEELEKILHELALDKKKKDERKTVGESREKGEI